jgi:hypothetical protein
VASLNKLLNNFFCRRVANHIFGSGDRRVR